MIHYLQTKVTKNLLALRKIFFWTALSWTGIILYLCLIKSNDLPNIGTDIPNFDKYVHAFFHLTFTILWYLYFKIYLKKSNNKKLFIIVFLLSFCFGVTIEVLQTLLTTTREGDPVDVLANSTGAVLGLLVILVLEKIRHSCKK